MSMTRLWRERRANVALLTGMLAVPLLGLVGLAIDYGSTSSVKAQLDLAADAAALVGTTSASNAYLARAADPIGPAQAAAVQRFRGQANSKLGFNVTNVTATVRQDGTKFVADVTYQATAPTTLGQLFGVSLYNVEGRSSASISVNSYIDVQVLMDVSSSMAVAATDADIARMGDLTRNYQNSVPKGFTKGEACAFACHWSSSSTEDDYYALARRGNVLLRIDVMRSAVANLITSISSLNANSLFRLGLYTFGKTFQQIYPLSENIDAASATLSGIIPDINGCTTQPSCADTYFLAAINNTASITADSGDGTSRDKSRKFLFIVTDGVVDYTINGGPRTIAPFSPSDCDQTKAKGVTVLTLYIPYLPLGDYPTYKKNVQKFETEIEPKVRACASAATLHFKASDAKDISFKLQQMLATTLEPSGRFTR